jgi:predicted secreted protein
VRALAALIALLLTAAVSEAADGAQSRAIGYSGDGKYFAFEQYGVQDGSGYVYWDIFILDLKANDWVKGTPIRVVLEDENQNTNLSEARKQAMVKASPIIEKLAIVEPADLLLANPFTEDVPDRTKVKFGVFFSAMEPPYQLSVSKVELPAPEDCTDPDFIPFGMELTLKVLTTGETVTLAKDSSIPKSRSCPLYYDIEAIYTPSGYGNEAANVVLIGVFSRGFEGADRHFIAVPFDLPDWQN